MRRSLGKYQELYLESKSCSNREKLSPRENASQLRNLIPLGKASPLPLDLLEQLEKSRTEVYKPLRVIEPMVVGGWKLK